MKPNELMIGDWVKVLPISRKVEAHYSKVGALTRNVDNTISIEGGYFPAWRGWSVSEEYIEPVSLTPEILEANKAEVCYESCYQKKYHIWMDDETCVEYKFSKQTEEYNNLKIYKGGGECVNIHVLYVHELQHALKDCKLYDLADNFKIE